MNILAPNTVLVTTADLREMANSWPGSGLITALSLNACVAFEFDASLPRNLVDIKWFDRDGVDISEPGEPDETCMLAISTDAKLYLCLNASKS